MKSKMLTKAAAILMAVVLLALSGCAIANVNYIEQGEKLFAEANYEKALAYFVKAIEKEPENPQGYIKAHDSCVAMQNNAEGFEFLKKGYDTTKNEEIKNIIKDKYLTVTPSKPAGFYQEMTSIELINEYEGVEIYYAIDKYEGYVPYEKPIEMPNLRKTKFLVKAKYADIESDNKSFTYKVEVVPTGYKWVIPPAIPAISTDIMDSCRSINDGLMAIPQKNEHDTKWGYMDLSFNLVIPLEYKRPGFFINGVATVEKDGKVGVINKKNEVVIPFEYDWGQTEDICIRLEKDEKIYLFDFEGNMVAAEKEGEDVNLLEEYEKSMIHESLKSYKYIENLGSKEIGRSLEDFRNDEGYAGILYNGNMVVEPEWLVALPLTSYKNNDEYAILYTWIKGVEEPTMGLIQYTYD